MKKPQTGRKGNVIRKERDDRKHLPPGDSATCRDRFFITVDLIVQEKKSQSSRYLQPTPGRPACGRWRQESSQSSTVVFRLHPFIHIRIQFLNTFRAYTMGEGRPGVVLDIGFDLIPVPFVIADLFA